MGGASRRSSVESEELHCDPSAGDQVIATVRGADKIVTILKRDHARLRVQMEDASTWIEVGHVKKILATTQMTAPENKGVATEAVAMAAAEKAAAEKVAAEKKKAEQVAVETGPVGPPISPAGPAGLTKWEDAAKSAPMPAARVHLISARLTIQGRGVVARLSAPGEEPPLPPAPPTPKTRIRGLSSWVMARLFFSLRLPGWLRAKNARSPLKNA